jgi:hypothetical protein
MEIPSAISGTTWSATAMEQQPFAFTHVESSLLIAHKLSYKTFPLFATNQITTSVQTADNHKANNHHD